MTRSPRVPRSPTRDHKRGGRPRFNDRNVRLPTDVLPLVRQWVDNLPDGNPSYDYLKTVVFEKFVSRDTSPADIRRSRAIEKWLKVDEVNAETNERLMSTPGRTVLLPTVRFGPFVDWVRSFIEQIIGAVPPEAVFDGSFSGGATTSRKDRKSVV